LAISLACIVNYSFLMYATSDVNILAITIPKAGGHLLYRCIHLLTKKQSNFSRIINQRIVNWDYSPSNFTKRPELIVPSLEILNNATNLQTDEFTISHLSYRKEYDTLLLNKKIKKIFIIRDPRDQIVSRAFYIQKLPGLYPGLQHLTLEQLITGLIGSITEPQDFDTLLTAHMAYYNKPQQSSFSNISAYYAKYIPWMSTSDCYVTRFEYLVGPKGGGSYMRQIREIKNIAKHLNMVLTDQDIEHVTKNIFGQTGTFREGKIGSWKKYFTHRQKRLFKKVAGNLLIRLGYEKNYNW
jgi:Sulfotransferase domain